MRSHRNEDEEDNITIFFSKRKTYTLFRLADQYGVLPTRMEKKNTPVIQLQVMKRISGMFWGFLFFPIDVAVFVAK